MSYQFLNEKGFGLGINGISIVDSDGATQYSLPRRAGLVDQALIFDETGNVVFKTIESVYIDRVGIQLNDLSVEVGSAGSANLGYDSETGVFTFVPPDLSAFLVAEDISNFVTQDSLNSRLDSVASNLSSEIQTLTTNSTAYALRDSLSTIAFSGSYNDLSNTPTIPTPAILSNGATPSLATGITGAEIRNLIGVTEFSGDYGDLQNAPDLGGFLPTDGSTSMTGPLTVIDSGASITLRHTPTTGAARIETNSGGELVVVAEGTTIATFGVGLNGRREAIMDDRLYTPKLHTDLLFSATDGAGVTVASLFNPQAGMYLQSTFREEVYIHDQYGSFIGPEDGTVQVKDVSGGDWNPFFTFDNRGESMVLQVRSLDGSVVNWPSSGITGVRWVNTDGLPPNITTDKYTFIAFWTYYTTSGTRTAGAVIGTEP